ncbi:glycosyltransferase family 58 protein [Sistotremastrum niveocremeum HHB9708]|uniref:Dol-P-Man:Man(5)GlcNAc(2)-PP-Dol alpha-1,3-mannosyltransferase n=1 Tax=Sistotremastrum niveocremeum HHB9708 TaxID=1314777 RepID=A0A165AJ09_9AGAM|nr:glycosyltransferase family 58 protein [Sistotremastrum niveocremeum HHB9708]
MPNGLSLGRITEFIRLVLTEPKYFWILAGLLLLGDACLCALIIRFVPYTEIDWITYMQQIQCIEDGQTEYAKIEGPTGPLVYPAGHVHIHRLLKSWFTGEHAMRILQALYAALYLLYLALSLVLYQQGGLPNVVVVLLSLSKRIHSVFMLRLFNDCWAVVAMQMAILAYSLKRDKFGTLLFSVALSVKMSNLLYAPALMVLLYTQRGLYSSIRHALLVIFVQILLAWEFLSSYPQSYLKNAFDLSRVFLYKWTVNWRMLDEDTFLSPTFSRALLCAHLVTLLVFCSQKWLSPEGGILTTVARGLRRPSVPASSRVLSADEIITLLFTSNLIGILFSRSLHYQFYSWYAYQIPYLAWRTEYPLLLKLWLVFSVEYAWNVYPSTTLSSSILFCSNALLLFGIFAGPSRASESSVLHKGTKLE